MKKIVTLLTTGLLTGMLSTLAFAETKPDVWHTDSRETDTKYSVSIESNGKATDGVIEMKYDKAALTCEEDSVAFAEFVDMHAINIEEGCVKISYLSAEAIPEGKFISVSFDVKEAYADKNVTVAVTSVAHNEAGEALITGVYQKQEDAEEKESETEETETEESEIAESEMEELEAEETEVEESEKVETEGVKETEKTEESEMESSEELETEEIEEVDTEETEKKDENDTAAVRSAATDDNIYVVAGILVLCVGLMIVALAFRKKKVK